MEQMTIIINDAPYGTEKLWNALRLASALLTRKAQVNVFLLGDSVSAEKRGQETPKGYYNLAKMLEDLLSRGAVVKACLTCLKARGLKQNDLIEGVEIGGMLDLADWCRQSDQVLTF